jgi:hypothetical protein
MMPMSTPTRLSRSAIGGLRVACAVAAISSGVRAQTKQPLTAPAATPTKQSAPSDKPATAVANAPISYTMTITSHGLNAEGKPLDFEMIATEQLLGDNARITFFDAANDAPPDGSPQQTAGRPMFYGHGSYYLVKRGAPTITVVSPTKKKYFELQGNEAAEQAVGKVLHVQLSDATIAAQRVQPDTSVQELQAQHWRITDSHTQKVTVLVISATSQIQNVMDYYFVPELKGDVNPFVHVGGIMIGAGSDDYRTKMQTALAAMPTGVPILSVERMTSTDKRGAGNSILITAMTNVSRDSLTPDLFEIPAGYEKSNHEVIPAEKAGYPASVTQGTTADQNPNQGQSVAGAAAKGALKGLRIP